MRPLIRHGTELREDGCLVVDWHPFHRRDPELVLFHHWQGEKLSEPPSEVQSGTKGLPSRTANSGASRQAGLQ